MKRIVIIGAGYAGLECALTLQQRLRPGEAAITLINKHDYHYPSTLLHRVSLGTYSARKGRVFLRHVIRPSMVHFIKDIVEHVDLDAKVVEGRMGCYPYDYLVMAAGFEGNTFGLPGVEENAYQMTSMNTALQLLTDMEARFKNFSFDPDPVKVHFAIVGAGFTGVEYAAELTDRLKELCEISGIDYGMVRITLVGRRDAILPDLGERGSKLAKRKLLALGVDFVVGDAVEVEPDGVVVEKDGERTKISADTILWAAGVRGSDLVTEAGIPNKNNRVSVDPFLRAPGREDVYVVGDCAAFTGKGEKWPYPGTAQIALQMGRYVGKRLAKIVEGKEPTEGFKYRYRGTVCSITHLDAVGLVMGVTISGEIAAFVKNMIENKWLFRLGGLRLVIKKGQFRSRTCD